MSADRTLIAAAIAGSPHVDELFSAHRQAAALFAASDRKVRTRLETELAAAGVADAAVVGVPDARWGETGVAFVAPAGSAGADTAGLLAHCARRLAKYKCPSRIIVIEAIPRSAAGKILKAVLRARLNLGEFE